MDRVAASARSDDERLGLVFSHPVWIVRAFRRALAAEGRADELEALLTADNASPRVTMAALPGLAEIPDAARRTPYSPVGFRLGGGDPEGLVRSSEGRVRVQDEGSQLAALALVNALPVADGERWPDLCAGPEARRRCWQRKRAPAARCWRRTKSPPRAPVSSARRSPAFRKASPSPRRTAAPAPGKTRTTAFWSMLRAPDSVRCAGAPRRAGGSPRRMPELTQLQGELLAAAVRGLRPGGVVAYVTCSPHLAETVGVVAEVRREFDGTLEELDARAVVTSLSASDPLLPPQSDGSGRAQLWPHRHNTDAMSITLLRRH